MSREQAVLYEAVVRKGMQEVERASEGMQRRGAILTTLLRLKQVCNHPAHYQRRRLGAAESLRQARPPRSHARRGDRRRRPLSDLHAVQGDGQPAEDLRRRAMYGADGAVPARGHAAARARGHGRRSSRPARPTEPRVFVLSLKAGGTGLNLTAANRVFHFDRWWNPAVEDQATDRAFRIGQRRNVFVHKFVCTGTLEERIQTMLDRKRNVANTLLGAGENWLTELSNEELRRLLILDRKEAPEGGNPMSEPAPVSIGERWRRVTTSRRRGQPPGARKASRRCRRSAARGSASSPARSRPRWKA